MNTKVRQEIEAAVSKAMQKFMTHQMGEHPEQVTTQIAGEMIIVRSKGVLPSSERHMTQSHEGKKLICELKTKLMEAVRPVLELLVREIANVGIIAMHSSFDADSNERIEVFTLSRNLEEVLNPDILPEGT